MRAHPHKPAPPARHPTKSSHPNHRCVSQSSHNGHRSPPNQPIPPVHPPSCESILTQSPIGDVATAIPTTRTVIMRANPHKPTPGTIIGKSAHAPTYATRHNGHPTTADRANQHQSILTTNAGAISRRHQLISTTIPFGASLWNTLRYTSRRIYTLHVFTVRWSFHGRTIRK